MSICKCLTSETVFCGKPAVRRERCADHLVQEWDDCLSRIAALEAELARYLSAEKTMYGRHGAFLEDAADAVRVRENGGGQ